MNSTKYSYSELLVYKQMCCCSFKNEVTYKLFLTNYTHAHTHTHTHIYVYIKVSRVGDLSRGLPEGSFLKSYYTKV